MSEHQRVLGHDARTHAAYVDGFRAGIEAAASLLQYLDGDLYPEQIRSIPTPEPKGEQ